MARDDCGDGNQEVKYQITETVETKKARAHPRRGEPPEVENAQSKICESFVLIGGNAAVGAHLQIRGQRSGRAIKIEGSLVDRSKKPCIGVKAKD